MNRFGWILRRLARKRIIIFWGISRERIFLDPAFQILYIPPENGFAVDFHSHSYHPSNLLVG
jgi:hypothetical protein